MRIWGDRFYHLSITSVFIATGFSVGAIGFSSQALAQNSIIPDNTLGNENSQTTRETIRGIESDRISGGARRGQNLFHSFERFDIGEGLGAYFDNPEAIRNIFSRVTGSDPSDILGRLGVIQAGSSDVLGNANLFFINPNGILFGPNASLDLGGSFAATTANGMQFGEQGFFSATSPEAPSQLLTIDPSAFFFNQVSGSIENQSTAGLRVPNSQSLILLGESVSLTGGRLYAPGGRIELAGVTSNGWVSLASVEQNLSLDYRNIPDFGNIQLTNAAVVDVSGEQAGDIQIQGSNQLLTEFSLITAHTQGSGNGGSITLRATDSITVDGGNIEAQVLEDASGDGGDITIAARTLTLRGSLLFPIGLIDTVTYGSSNAGNITINAEQLTATNEGIIASATTSEASTAGNAGNILIKTDELSLTEGGRIESSTFGAGNAGNTTIQSSNFVEVTGASSRGFNSRLTSQVREGASGNGGDLLVETDRLIIGENAQVQAGLFGSGQGGGLVINATQSIDIIDTNNDAEPTGIFVGPEGEQATGNAGNSTIRAEQLNVQGGGSEISNAVDSDATGNAGDILIDVNRLMIGDGAQIRAETFETGKGGRLTIIAHESVDLSGTSLTENNNEEPAGIFLLTFGLADAGSLDLTTGRLSIRNGATITASTAGLGGEETGRGGDLTINASEAVEIIGTSPSGELPSSIVSEAGRIFNIDVSSRLGITPTDAGGDIVITAEQLTVQNGAYLSTATYGSGSAGNITLIADRVILSGTDPDFERRSREFGDTIVANVSSASGLFVNTEANSTGSGGTITIQADSLLLSNGAQISAATSGTGSAGDIIIRDTDRVSLNNASITTAVNSEAVLSDLAANQGNIEIQTRSLSLSNNANITASTSGQGNAGDVTIRGAETITLDRSSISTAVNENAIGEGGDIEIQTGDLTVRDRAQISASTAGRGRAGNIVVDADTVNLFDRGQLRTSTNTNRPAGDITLNADRLNLDRGRISAESTGTGRAGDITLNVADRLQVSNGQILTSAEQASGGAITINAENADVRLSGTSDISTSVGSGAGSGGNIAVTAETIQLHDDSDIRTSVAGGQGDGGNITLRASSILAFDDSDIIAATPAGQGGDITLDTDAFFAEDFDPDAANANPNELEDNDRADVNASGAQPGTITTPDTSLIQNSLTELPESAIDSDTLLANSCVVRNQDQSGTFTITGTGGLPQRPGDAPLPTYPTNSVRSTEESSGEPTWQMGDPIVEPEGLYRLEDGRMVLSRECR